ncbi:MAG: YIP1 family protein [Nitrospiraceae bacterium]|nr:MAG: YIP1 family protein [Nitrospiraceae bacterium]
MSSFKDRIVRAAKLDAQLYEEVEADKSALNQALVVVILSSLAGSLNIGRMGFGGIFIGIVITLTGWIVWAYLTYVIGTKLLPESETESSFTELLRTIGFSSSPGLIRVVGVVPFISGPVFFITSIWMLVAMVIAVRQALDYRSTKRAVGVCLIGWVFQLAVMAVMFSLLVETAAK